MSCGCGYLLTFSSSLYTQNQLANYVQSMIFRECFGRENEVLNVIDNLLHHKESNGKTHDCVVGGQAFLINLEHNGILNSTLELIKCSTVCSANRQDETTSPQAVLCRVSHILNIIEHNYAHQGINSQSCITTEHHREFCIAATLYICPYKLTRIASAALSASASVAFIVAFTSALFAAATLIASASITASACHCLRCAFRTTLDQVSCFASAVLFRTPLQSCLHPLL